MRSTSCYNYDCYKYDCCNYNNSPDCDTADYDNSNNSPNSTNIKLHRKEGQDNFKNMSRKKRSDRFGVKFQGVHHRRAIFFKNLQGQRLICQDIEVRNLLHYNESHSEKGQDQISQSKSCSHLLTEILQPMMSRPLQSVKLIPYLPR